jgi:hypothetical protein
MSVLTTWASWWMTTKARRPVEQHGATFFMGAPGAAPGVKGTTDFEQKYRDPDGIIFDISGHGWAGTAEWKKPQVS